MSKIEIEKGAGTLGMEAGTLGTVSYGTHSVTFAAAFDAAPYAVAGYGSQKGRGDSVNVESVSTTGMTIRYTKVGGGASEDAVINWIAVRFT